VSDKKKYGICHLLYEEYPRDPRVRRYVNAVNETGINCIIICSRKKNEKYFEELNNNRIYRIPVSKKRGAFFITLLEYITFTSISSTLLIYLSVKYRFKVIHAHSLPDFLVFSALWNKIFGTKIILDLHEIFPELYMARTGAALTSFKVKLLKTAERLAIGFSDVVLTIHDNARDIFASRNKGIENKIHVVMNSVDPAEFSDRNLIDTGEFNIVYNGTVVKLLNLTMITEALASLKEKMQEDDFNRILFKIYGDGPALEEILLLAKKLGVDDRVKYMGYIQPAEMSKEILKTSVLVLPPLKNIYSDLFYTIKLIEAVYLGVPVIATRLNTYKEYYREESIFYFNSGSLNELCAKIEEVFYNKELVKKKTENAFKDYSKVNWDIMKKRYLNIINSLLN